METEKSTEAYVNYAHSPDNAWVKTERRIFDYLFSRFYKDRFNYLNNESKVNIPKIKTAFGQTLPENFSVLDLGTATGRVATRMIEYGVRPRNIVTVDIDLAKLDDSHFPIDVQKIHGDVVNISELLSNKFRDSRVNFELITANMLFHLLTYDDYVSCLSQVRNRVREYRSQLMMVVPHPLREELESIREYHSQKSTTETAPWGEKINYQIKTIQDYVRGLREAGFTTTFIGTAGVGIGEDSRLFLHDEAVWSELERYRKTGHHTKLPHCFRLWLVATPSGDLF